MVFQSAMTLVFQEANTDFESEMSSKLEALQMELEQKLNASQESLSQCQANLKQSEERIVALHAELHDTTEKYKVEVEVRPGGMLVQDIISDYPRKLARNLCASIKKLLLLN